VVDILEVLARSPEGLGLRDVSAQLEAPKSSLLPLLRALTARGYLAHGRAGEYRLGPGALDLAAAPAQRDLVEVGRRRHKTASRSGAGPSHSADEGSAIAVILPDRQGRVKPRPRRRRRERSNEA
jgi:DNA-binding IclR family transcriptional regulator